MANNIKVIQFEYNINGIGIITPQIYPFAANLYNEKELNIESRLKETNQLGAIRYIHNGAHYTRYEYMLLQMMLINFVKNNGNLGLGSNFTFSTFGLSESLEYKKKVTRAEILELMVLFGNMGHFKDTFASNKVWFHYLYTDKFKMRKCLKKGLKSESKKLLDVLLLEGEYQKIQWINTLFLLSRSAKLNDYRLIGEVIVSKLLLNKDDKWLDMYYRIRKVSYLVLDSHYSHIPVNISLQNVLFNIDWFIDELSKYSSGLMATFDRINDLLEDTLYLENNALLMGTYRSVDIFRKINQFVAENSHITGITKISKLVSDENASPFFEDFKITDENIPWNKNKNLSLTFFVKKRHAFPIDVFGEELKKKQRLGRNCYIALNFSPGFTKYRTVYSIRKNVQDEKLVKECLKIINSSLEDYLKYKSYSYESVSNGPLTEVVLKKIITYLFRNLLDKDYYCDYEYPKFMSPFIIENGSKTAVKEIDKYIKDYQNQFPNDVDGLHELKTVRSSLESLSYKGLIIAYLGSIRFIDEDKLSVCELDGVILTPKHKQMFLQVIEAKNISKKRRASIASKQLEKKFVPLLSSLPNGKVERKDIYEFGAQVNILI